MMGRAPNTDPAAPDVWPTVEGASAKCLHELGGLLPSFFKYVCTPTRTTPLREQEAWCTVQVAGSYLRMSSCQTNSESAKTSAARGSAGPAPAACMAARKEHATELRCDT
eukprot:SAG11_NODE_6147_length_1377_cov_1.378717_1_plen_109_part_10